MTNKISVRFNTAGPLPGGNGKDRTGTGGWIDVKPQSSPQIETPTEELLTEFRKLHHHLKLSQKPEPPVQDENCLEICTIS